MAYDEVLAERVRAALHGRGEIDARKMFGGIAFMARGKMFAGIVGDDLMVRVGPERHEEALGRPHTRPMDFTRRPMRGYVFVARAGLRTKRQLAAWLDWGFAASERAKKR
ncbi:MAG: TfoX/Sxy family protein [Methanobacteriota archaeon]